jgi:VanZ family protein
VVAVSSILPAQWLPDALDDVDYSDKAIHLVAYAVLGLLPALHERRPVLFLMVAGTFLMGVALELGQATTGTRFFELLDIASNGTGLAVGVLAGRRLSPWRESD